MKLMYKGNAFVESNWNILDFFRVFNGYDFLLNRSLMGMKLCNSIMQHKNPIIFHWVVQKYLEKLDENCTDKLYVAVESNYYSHANLLERFAFIQKISHTHLSKGKSRGGSFMFGKLFPLFRSDMLGHQTVGGLDFGEGCGLS